MRAATEGAIFFHEAARYSVSRLKTVLPEDVERKEKGTVEFCCRVYNLYSKEAILRSKCAAAEHDEASTG